MYEKARLSFSCPSFFRVGREKMKWGAAAACTLSFYKEEAVIPLAPLSTFPKNGEQIPIFSLRKYHILFMVQNCSKKSLFPP